MRRGSVRVKSLWLPTFLILVASLSLFSRSASADNPDLTHRYVILLDGIRSSSPPDSPLNNGDFARITNGLAAAGIQHFVYFSYAAAGPAPDGGALPSTFYCNGWGLDACSGDDGEPGTGGLVSLDAPPIYTVADTQQPVDRQADVLEWLIGQVVQQDPSAQVDLVGYSLGGIISTRWAALHDATTSTGMHVRDIVLIESPVGGIPMAGPVLGAEATRDCGPIGEAFACTTWDAALRYLFGKAVLRDLQLPADDPTGSIIASLPQAAASYRLTAIQSSADYLVNDAGIPLCDQLACLTSSSVNVGRGAQVWLGRGFTLHSANELGGDGLATGPQVVLAAVGRVQDNHGAPLFDARTTDWVVSALVTQPDAPPVVELPPAPMAQPAPNTSPAPSPGPAPQAGPTSPSAPLYATDAQHGWSGWNLAREWSIQNGLLVNDGTRESSNAMPPFRPGQINDYAAEAEIKWIGGSMAFGLPVRQGAILRPDVYAGYSVSLFETVARITRDAQCCIATGSFDPGHDWHTYRVEVKGPSIRFLIDGVLKAAATDATHPNGDETHVYSSNSRVQVRRYSIVRL